MSPVQSGGGESPKGKKPNNTQEDKNMTDYREEYKDLSVPKLKTEKRRLNSLDFNDEVADRLWAVDFWLTSKKETVHTPLQSIEY